MPYLPLERAIVAACYKTSIPLLSVVEEELEADTCQALEPMAWAGAGGVHADHGTRRNIATSEGHNTGAPEPGQEASVSCSVNGSLTNDLLFPHSGALLKSVITGGSSDQVIQCVPFCPQQSLLIIQN